MSVKPVPSHDATQVVSTGKPTTDEFRWKRSVKKTMDSQESSLALKAPIASPVFTGNPQAPTPSPGDNDTSIATTAFTAAAITAAISAIPAAGMALVATVPTTSGATASVTGLPAAKAFRLVLAGVSHNAAGITTQTLRVALSVNNGSAYGTPNNISSAVQSANALSGVVSISHLDGTTNFVVGDAVGGVTTTLDNSVTGTVNALQFSWTGDSFDAGVIYIYALR